MTVQETRDLAQKNFDLYNNRGSDSEWLTKTLTLVTEDCEVVDIPSGMVLHGPEGYKQFLLGWATAFPDSKGDVTNLFATEDQAVVEFRGHGTHTGPLHGPAGEIPPTNGKLDLRFCQLFHIRNGKIASIVTYYDSMRMMQQLGLIPQMG
jgi:steroid delta-isomerase-like uncharacterized protein